MSWGRSPYLKGLCEDSLSQCLCSSQYMASAAAVTAVSYHFWLWSVRVRTGDKINHLCGQNQGESTLGTPQGGGASPSPKGNIREKRLGGQSRGNTLRTGWGQRSALEEEWEGLGPPPRACPSGLGLSAWCGECESSLSLRAARG